jgi:ABC-type nitrate/sulfonate/bicarbonate transport system substrate-binding protein
MKVLRHKLILLVTFFAASVLTFGNPNSFAQSNQTTKNILRLRIAVTPFQDTTLMLIGIQKGFFRDEGIDLQPIDSTWNEQLELLAGGGADIAMGTIDEVVAKDKNLTLINKRLYYFLPAWLFEGMIFVTRPDILSIAEIRAKYGEKDSACRFLEQIKNKVIAVPEGGVYEQALRQFIIKAGMEPSKFRFVNSKLEAGIYALDDPKVGLAAAGIVQRLEAQRRNYKIALETLDLGVTVITGFVSTANLFERQSEALTRFSCGWFKSVRYALDHMEENFSIVSKYIDQQGGRAPSYEDFKTALGFQKIPKSPQEAKERFLTPTSPMYWEKAWDSAVQHLRDTGKAADVSGAKDSFVAGSVLNSSENLCP